MAYKSIQFFDMYFMPIAYVMDENNLSHTVSILDGNFLKFPKAIQERFFSVNTKEKIKGKDGVDYYRCIVSIIVEKLDVQLNEFFNENPQVKIISVSYSTNKTEDNDIMSVLLIYEIEDKATHKENHVCN